MLRSVIVAGALALVSCASPAEVTIPSVRLRMPLGLDDVVGDLRLLVFPATQRTCDAVRGELTPAVPDPVPETFDDAIANLTFGVGSRQEVDLDEGTYSVLVRGRGTDPVSGRSGVIIASGCAGEVVIAAGATREISIPVREVFGEGQCGDGILSPDEQCEEDLGPFPCVDCRTQAFVPHTTTDGAQDAPSLAWRPDARLLLSFGSDGLFQEVRMMLRAEDGSSVVSPTALSVDNPIDLAAPLSGTQAGSAAATNGERFAVAFGDFSTAATMGGDVYIRTLDSDRRFEGPPILLAPSPGAQTDPRAAILDDGTTLTIFADESRDGLAGRILPATSQEPLGTGPFTIGEGAAQGDVARLGGGFGVVYLEAGRVRLQRVAASGMPDGEAFMVSETGATVPRIAGLDDGRGLVAWVEDRGVMVRAISPEGPEGDILLLEERGEKVAIAGGSERYVATWSRDGEVRAAVLDVAGQILRSRERPPSAEPFTLGRGSRSAVAIGGRVDGRIVASFAWVDGEDLGFRLTPL